MSTRTRRHRRQFKQLLKYGPSAKPTHKALGGRTGQVRAKQRKQERDSHERNPDKPAPRVVKKYYFPLPRFW
jgi:hypothetical protein